VGRDTRGKEALIHSQAQLHGTATKLGTRSPPLPALLPNGNYPAIEYARASLDRGISRDRIEAGLSRRELAQRSGIRVETLCRIETGKHTASVPTFDKIHLALNRALKGSRRSRPAGDFDA
jgi:DNA-binding XRE family transcriptional regulator